MARTKQTTRRSTGGQAPRKQLTSAASQKRPLEIEDNDDDGNERKKIKLDLHDGDDSSDYSDVIGAACETSSDSSDYADDADNSQMENVQSSVKATLESKKYSDSSMLKFIKNLNAMSSATQAKINELQYREKARSKFLAGFQREIRKPKFDATFFAKELFEFAKSVIQAFRFRSVETDYSDYGTFRDRWTDYSVDIALTSRKNFVHPKYEEAMHGLLGRHVHDIQPISHLITQYTNNQFAWYRLELTMDDSDSEDRESWQDKAQGGILHGVEYDANDYFRDSKFYKAKKPSTGAPASFAKMRKDLKIKRSLTDAQLAQFIGVIAVFVFSLDEDDFDDAEEWIIKQHG